MDRTWRPPKSARASAVVGLAIVPIMAVALATAPPHGARGPAWPAILPLALAAFVAARFAFYVRLTLRQDSVLIVNVFSTRAVELADVKDAKAGYTGLTFSLRSGGSATATVGQVSNAARLSGRPGRGGEIAATVLRTRDALRRNQ